MYHVSCEPLRIFWNDDTTCSTWVPCVLPTTGWIPGFSACSGQHAWHSCRAGCIVISESPQGLATHMVHRILRHQGYQRYERRISRGDWNFNEISNRFQRNIKKYLQDISYLNISQISEDSGQRLKNLKNRRKQPCFDRLQQLDIQDNNRISVG